METSLRNYDKTGTSLDRILYLSDQNEYRHYSRMEKDSHRQKRSILIITRPLLQKEFITEKCEGMFDHIFSWRDLVPPSFNPFTNDYLTEPELINIIEAAKWPQSLSEIFGSDQYAHTSVSGRFYQSDYSQTYLSNCFAITYSLTKHAIGCVKPRVAYTSEINDVNKVGALCALLIAGIPIVVPELVNVRDLVLLKVIRRKDNHISNVFYGQDEAMPFELFRNSESKVGNKIYINWDLYGCMKDTGLSETSSQDITRVMRATQYERRGTTEKINAAYEMRRFANNFKMLLRSVFAIPKILAKARCNFVIPLHKKNSMHYLQSVFVQQVYSIVCRYRSIRDRLLLQWHALLGAKHCSRRILLCLHYFPESSTIGGISWRNIKHELAFLAIPEVQHYLHPGDVTVVEHPAYLMNGERPRLFWRRLTKLGYRNQVRRSLGVDLSNISEEQIITITGSIALEAALLGKESVIVKNSQLLNVQNIKHISDVLDIRDFEVRCRKKISANKYLHICQAYALSADKIYPSQVFESVAHEE